MIVGVYPRACGGTVDDPTAARYGEGLSPRVRGNRGDENDIRVQVGSIPARAGEPGWWQWSPPCKPVYPRACGGTLTVRGGHHLRQGLSPRVRGNLVYLQDAIGGGRSIPARAGEPGSASSPRSAVTVYPRACGGTGYVMTVAEEMLGLSPRVRGNPLLRPSPRPPCGSIPARAGEPAPGCAGPATPWVYPRACGGTLFGHCQ